MITMPEIPECLSRRYKAVDELISALNARYEKTVSSDSPSDMRNSDDVGIKLMCDFWNILKENPDCDLTRIVKERMGLHSKSSNLPRKYQCYTIETPKEASCCKITTRPEASKQELIKKSVDNLSLTKVLCNLKDAASTDRKCNIRIKELMEKEKELREQIEMLEQREKDAQELLQQADCMWSCMESAYKEKIVEKKDKIEGVVAELAQVENNVLKWRQRKKDLESQVESVDKYYKEIIENINNKLNDIQAVRSEVDSYQKKTKAVMADVETVKKTIEFKKKASDKKVQQYQKEIKDIEQTIKDEKSANEKKDKEVAECIKAVREEYTNICKTLMERKLRNADLESEAQALQVEYDTLMESRDACEDKCNKKEQSIIDEIKKIDKEIAEFKLRCLRCHQNSSTTDIKRFCTDCPRCLEKRECLIKGDICERDSAKDCVCMTIKKKFLNNVFENMYSILETEADAPSGKSIASDILKSLRISKNGKLDLETKKKLQKFVLDGVKKDINLTIVGGAVKTRCEMDDRTYKQLMLCLKVIKPPSEPKQDSKGTIKKDPCYRWPGGIECNCPKGPSNCICSQKAPLFPGCTLPTNKENMAGRGPYKLSSSCGPDRPMRTSTATSPDTPGRSQGTQKKSGHSKKPELKRGEHSKPGKEKDRDCSCYTKNMRAAQCVLGPDSLEAAFPGNLGKRMWSPTNCTSVSEMNEAINDANEKLCNCSRGIKYHVTDYEAKQHNSMKPSSRTNTKSTKHHLLDTLYGVDYRPHGYFDVRNNYFSENADEFEGNSVIKVKVKSKKQCRTCKGHRKGKHYYLNEEQLKTLKESIVGETDSQSYIVDNNININGVKPEDLLKYLINKSKKPGTTTNFESSEDNARYIKVKLENAGEHLKEPQALLELTASKNFTIVLDKEYEKEFKAEMSRRVSESMNSVLLRKSVSGTYRINFRKEVEEDINAKCGKLVQSPSGKFKVIIHENNDTTLITIKKPKETSNDTSSYILACDKEECICRQLPSDLTNVKKSNSIVGYVEITKDFCKTDTKVLKNIWVQPNFDFNRSEEESFHDKDLLEKNFQKKKKQKIKFCEDKGKGIKNAKTGPHQYNKQHSTNKTHKGNSHYQNIVFHVGVDNTKSYDLNAKTNEQRRVKFNEIKKRNVFQNTNKSTLPDQKKAGRIIGKEDSHATNKRKDKEYVYHKNSMICNDLVVYSSQLSLNYLSTTPRPHKYMNSMGSIADKCCLLANKNGPKRKCQRRSLSPKRLGRRNPYKQDCSGDRLSHRSPSGSFGAKHPNNNSNHYPLRTRIRCVQ